MPEFISRGLRLKYLVQGEGTPFLFLHGLGGGIAQIRNTYKPIPGVRLITLDQQGHGGSDICLDTYGFAALAEDAAALADHLQITSFYLGGISMGAAVSVNLALRYPKRVLGLALIRLAWTDRPMHPDIRRLYGVLAQFLEQDDREGFLRTHEYAFLSSLSAYTSGTFAAAFDDPASLKHYQKFLILPSCSPYDAAVQLKSIHVPAVVIANRNDYVHPFEYGEYFAQNIPGARLQEIPDKDSDPVGHTLALNEHLKDFLPGGAEI